MAIVWHNINEYVSIGVDWCATDEGNSVSLAPKVYRWDSDVTDNYGSTFSEYLNPDPNDTEDGKGEWHGISWPTGSGEREIDKFVTRTYYKTGSEQTVSLTVEWDSSFGSYYSGSFHNLGNGSHTWTYTVPALSVFTVSYDANGGEGTMSPSTAKYGENFITKQNVFSRVGHKFVGWNEKPDGTGEPWKLADGVGTYESGTPWVWTYTSDITLYAQWEIYKYDVVFIANGGTNAPEAQIKTYGEDLVLTNDVPVRDKYNFKGWATSEIKANAGTVEYESGSIYSENSHMNMYAVWESIYEKPTISNLELTRCDESGNDAACGKYVKVSFDWTTDKELYLVDYLITSDGGMFVYAAGSLDEQKSSGNITKIITDYTFYPYEADGISVKIEDSEGGQASITHTIEKEVYVLPEISNISAIRTGEDRVKNDEGECGLITFDWSIDKMRDGSNSVSNITVAYQEHGTGLYPNAVEVEYDNSVDSSSATAFVPNNVLDSGKSYDFVITVEDKISSVVKYTIITYAFCTIDFRAGGKGIAVGKYSDADIFDVDMPAKFRKEIEINGRKYGENQILWSSEDDTEDAKFLGAGSAVAFNHGRNEGELHKVSEQPNGIVLVFSYFDNEDDTAENATWNCHFIPKSMIGENGLDKAGSHTLTMATFTSTIDIFGIKHLYISDTRIDGYVKNSITETSACGIKYSNNSYVLRYVIGV